MFDPLDVPGYDVLAPLGSARTWKAIAVADRARVVLRPVHGGDEARRRLRQAAALWSSVANAHVVAVRDVFRIEPDVNVVVSDHAPGGGLDALLSRRGSLDDGEIVTLVVPLAQTLAAAHQRGLAHRRVSTGNVVFGDDGRPMLTDAVLGSGVAGDDAATDDVAALVSVARTCLGDRRSGPVWLALATPVASADDLARVVRAAAPACAIALHQPVAAAEMPTEQPPRPRRRRHFAIAAIVAAALILGMAWGQRDTARATRVPQPVAPQPAASAALTVPSPWWGVVQRLERDRTRTYATRLARTGLRPVGLRIRLRSVRLLAATGDRAVVRIIDGWASYDVMRADGRVVARRPARSPHAVTLVLHRTPGGWRLRRVGR